MAERARDSGTKAINTNPSPKRNRERKTDEELTTQAAELNRLGEALKQRGLQLQYHTHDPEMAENAREWRWMLRHTDPALVTFCMDTHWIWRGKQDPLALLREAGKRTASLHVRNSRDGVWSEGFGPGDLDYKQIAAEVKRAGADPWVVVELAYEKGTVVTRSLAANLRAGREYALQTFT